MNTNILISFYNLRKALSKLALFNFSSPFGEDAYKADEVGLGEV